MASDENGEERRRNELLRIMNIAESLLGASSSSTSSTTTRSNNEERQRLSSLSLASSSTAAASGRPPGPTSRTPTNATSQSSSSSAAVNNFRRLFQPYNQASSNFMMRSQQTTSTRSSVVSRRGKGRKGWKFQGRQSVKESWTHDFFCLSRRDAMYPPNTRQKLELADAGLGRKKVIFSSDGDAMNVVEKLESVYPKLKDCGGFELLRSQGVKDPLRLILPPQSGYSVPFLRDVSGLGCAVAYVRPIQMDLSMSKMSPIDPQEGQTMEAFNVTCFGCQSQIPIGQLRNHHEICVSNKDKQSSVEEHDTEDPKVECENCLAQVKFSEYANHVKDCGNDSDVELLENGFASLNDKESDALVIGKNEETKEEEELKKIAELINLPMDASEIYLQRCHSGNFATAVDSYLNEGILSVILSILGSKLQGPVKYIKISESSEAFGAAVSYFKGPEYEQRRPISVQYGVAIDAGGPKRQFFQTVLDTALSGDCLKLFEGSSGKIVPVCSSMTLMSNVLEIMGRIVAHSIIEQGPSFPYLAPPIYWYIISNSMDSAMQHATMADVVSAGVKYVIDKISQATTDEEIMCIMRETEVQIVLDESQWDRSTTIKSENKLTIIQWLLQYDILVKREKAIIKFAKGMESLDLLNYMKKYPDHFEPLFVWSEEQLSADAVLELLETDDDDLDDPSAHVWDLFQQFVRECNETELKNLLKFLTGSTMLPSKGLPNRTVNVKFVDGDGFFASTCLMEVQIPKSFNNREEFNAGIQGALGIKEDSFNTW